MPNSKASKSGSLTTARRNSAALLGSTGTQRPFSPSRVGPGAQGPSAREMLFTAEKARRDWRCCCCRASRTCRSPSPSPSSRLLSKASRLCPSARWSHQPDPATRLVSLGGSVRPGLGGQQRGGAAAGSQACVGRLPAACFLQGLRCWLNVGQDTLGECGNLLFLFVCFFLNKVDLQCCASFGFRAGDLDVHTYVDHVFLLRLFQVTARYWVWFPVLYPCYSSTLCSIVCACQFQTPDPSPSFPFWQH